MTSTAFFTIMLTSFLVVTEPLSSKPKPTKYRLVLSVFRNVTACTLAEHKMTFKKASLIPVMFYSTSDGVANILNYLPY